MDTNKVEFLNLGLQPLANGFMTDEERLKTSEFYYELKVGIDINSGLVTLMNYVDAPLMFNDHYAYHGSISETMREHFRIFADRIINEHKPKKVLEIGSNDGVFLRNFPKEGTFGVEPCGNFAKITEEMGYRTYARFWNKDLALEIRDDNDQMDLIYAANCICHIPDLDETFQAVHALLSDEGYFIFEDPSLLEMINRTSYDQIYDEHAHVFSCFALNNILSRNGLTLVHVEHLKVHGGSNRIWVKKSGNPSTNVSRAMDLEILLGLNNIATYQKFAEEVEKSKNHLTSIMIKARESGFKLAGYGATSKSTTVYNYCGITSDILPFVTDTTPSKIGRKMPGTNIPIIDRKGCDDSVDIFYLGAWNFADEISRRETDFIARGGRFLTHVPKVMII